MVSMTCKSSFLSGQYAGSSSVFFCKSKLQTRQKGRAAKSNTSREISLHGLPSKRKRPSIRKQIVSPLSSQLVVSLFLRNSHLQRDIQQTFFCQYFCKLLESSCSTSKNVLQKFLESSQKNIRGKCYFSKVAGFYRSSQRRCSVKKGCSQKCILKIYSKTPVRDSILIKLQA